MLESIVEVVEKSPVYCKMVGSGMGLYNMKGLRYLGLHTVAAFESTYSDSIA